MRDRRIMTLAFRCGGVTCIGGRVGEALNVRLAIVIGDGRRFVLKRNGRFGDTGHCFQTLFDDERATAQCIFCTASVIVLSAARADDVAVWSCSGRSRADP